MRRRTAVIGGGPAGCFAAYLLQRSGRDVVLFEAEPHLGGRTASWREQGWVLDSGAGFFTDFYPLLQALLTSLDMDDERVALSRTNALTDGAQIVDFTLGSPLSFARFAFLSARAKLRLGMQTAMIALRYKGLDLSDPATLAATDDMSIRDAALELFGEDAFQYLVRPGIEPFWFFPCASVSRALLLGLQARAPTAKFYTLRSGMDTLCTRLMSAGASVRTGASVASVTAGAAGGLRLAGRDLGAVAAADFAEVVLATTASVAQALTADLPSALVGPPLRQFLASQQYVANVHAAFLVSGRSRWRPMSALFPWGPGERRVSSMNFNSYKNQSPAAARGDQEVVSIYLSPAESGPMLEMSDAAAYEHAWRLGRAFYDGLPAKGEPWRLSRRAEAIPVHAVGRYRAAVKAQAAQRGPVVFAGDYLATATVDGALRSGYLAAKALVPGLSW